MWTTAVICNTMDLEGQKYKIEKPEDANKSYSWIYRCAKTAAFVCSKPIIRWLIIFASKNIFLFHLEIHGAILLHFNFFLLLVKILIFTFISICIISIIFAVRGHFYIIDLLLLTIINRNIITWIIWAWQIDAIFYFNRVFGLHFHKF